MMITLSLIFVLYFDLFKLIMNRPVAGYINFCPTAIDGSQTDDYLLTVAKHEMLHTLVYNE